MLLSTASLCVSLALYLEPNHQRFNRAIASPHANIIIICAMFWHCRCSHLIDSPCLVRLFIGLLFERLSSYQLVQSFELVMSGKFRTHCMVTCDLSISNTGYVMQVNVNLAGIPALVVPCGFVEGGVAGLPVGLQMIGSHFDEVTNVAIDHCTLKLVCHYNGVVILLFLFVPCIFHLNM